MFYKKSISILLSALIILSNFSFTQTIVKAVSDATPPVLNNIIVDKKAATNGDKITVTVDASDDISGIKGIDVFYAAPSGSAIKYASLLKNAEGKYSGTITIGQNDATGMWRVKFVALTDNASNSIDVCNTEEFKNPGNGILQDLSSGDFEVSGTISDTTFPVLNNIIVDKKAATNGDKIIVTVDASDDISGIKGIDVFYAAPSGSAIKYASLLKNAEGKYSGTITIGQNDATGMWRVKFVSLTDNASNSINVYNTEEFTNSGNGVLQDLSSGDFEVKEINNIVNPLPQKCVTQNEYWTNNTIDGDLYIGPQAVLMINGSVTVNGNIYVLGAIKNYGNLTVTGTVYASQFNWGNSTLYNGTVLMLGGTNYIGAMVASNAPIDIPLKVYEANGENTLTAKEGTLNITGATLPIIDLYVDGIKVIYNNDGTFSLNLNVTNKISITFQTVDVFGNKKDLKYNIVNSNSDGTISVTGINLDKTQTSLKVGETTSLVAIVNPISATNKNITWLSSNTSMATVDSMGKVTAVSNGSAYITATTVDGGYTASCAVTIVKPVTGVSLDKTNISLKVGETTNIIAIINPVDASNKNVTWSSSNNSVATIDGNGKVIAVGRGTSTITVTTMDGSYKESSVVTVVSADLLITPIRYAGASRFETAVEVSKAGWVTSSNVVLVNAYGFADALTGVPFAYQKDAPILLTEINSIPKATSDEIKRLGAKNIYILGGIGVVSQRLEDELKSNGFNVFRLAGLNRFETALKIGNEVLKSNSSKTAILTIAYNYPDALAISSYAAINQYPILYTDTNTLDEKTRDFIKNNGITKIIIPGGTGAVSENIANELRSIGIVIERISGTDRYNTALNIVKQYKSSYKNDIMLATGNNFPDALAGGVLAAKKQIPILLVDNDSVRDEVKSYIRENWDINMYILGGTGAVSDNIVNLIIQP